MQLNISYLLTNISTLSATAIATRMRMTRNEYNWDSVTYCYTMIKVLKRVINLEYFANWTISRI
jgi:SepF-like predicted cell division protein (DUF552 family)